MVCELDLNKAFFFNEYMRKHYFNVNVTWTTLRCVAADGGRNTCGAEKSLVGLIYKA